MMIRSMERSLRISGVALAAMAVAFLFVALACVAQQPKDQAGAGAGSHDFTGVWKMPPEAYGHYDQSFGTTDLPMTPWAKKKFDAARASEGPKSVAIKDLNDPFYACYPPGVPRIYLHPFAMEIMQTPKEMAQMFEYDHLVRHIYTDGRPHPDDPDPTWMGNSVGRWEGDTLVVDTRNFVDDHHWIDNGIPGTDALRIIERMRLIDKGATLEIEYAMTDPKSWEGEWKMTKRWRRVDDTDITEASCLPDLNEHMPSTQSKQNVR